MSAEAAGSVEAGVGAVGVDADLDPLTKWAFRDLQFQRPVGHAIVVHDLTLSCTHRISSRLTPGMGVKAEPSPAGSTAKRALWAGRKTSWMKALAASAVGSPQA
jgi:hypothetical protein